MKVKNGFIVRKIADRYMAVPVGSRAKELHGMMALNETGAFLWKKLEKETNKEELVKALLDEYEVSEENANNAVIDFIEDLKKEGMLDDRM